MNSNNPSMAYFHESLGHNYHLVEVISVLLPDSVFYDSAGTGKPRSNINNAPKSSKTPGSGKGKRKSTSKASSVEDRLDIIAASRMAERNESIAYKNNQDAYASVMEQYSTLESEHNSILNSFKNHCGGDMKQVKSRIKSVKQNVAKKNNLHQFCYDESDSDSVDSHLPDSQEDCIKSFLRKREAMDELKARADSLKSKL